jgi:preprotein translocase subunit SecE
MMQRIKSYLKASYEEFVLRTTWPSWPALQKSTIVVIIGSIIFAMLVFVMDKGITTVLDVIYRLFA